MTFPTTPVLDNFDRADEGPPLSVAFGWADVPTVSGCQIVSNECAGSIDIQWENLQHWGTPTGDDCEVYFTVTSLSSPSGIHADLIARHQIGDSLASYDQCYRLTVNNGIAGQIDLYVEDGGHTLLGQWPETPVDPFADGASFGISCVGSTISAWYKPPAGSWSEVISVTDATWSDGGYIGFDIRRLPVTIDNFGGGDVGGGPTPPVADFSGTPLTGAAPLSVDFTDLSTNTPTSWLWDFGDSVTDIEQNPTHEYDTPGTYTVALTATNGDGSDTETKIDYVTVTCAPTAEFSGTPTSGLVALSVDFTDLSTDFPASWFWDFGDGGYSTDQNPTHIYNYIGVYTVTLTVTNSCGSDSETKVDYITVTADVSETGLATIENCDIDTGGAAVGLRIQDVAIARDNILGSLTIDASAELRAKDNSYATLVNNGTLTPLMDDRSAWDVDGYPDRHASDIDGATFGYHNNPANPPLSAYLDNGSIFVGNISNQATGVAMSGDATIANTGALTIADDAVTYAKMQNITTTQRALGRNTAGAGNTEEVTASQLLDWLGSTRGAVLYRGAAGWAILEPGTEGYALTSNGAGADPTYQLAGAEVLMADGVTPPDPLTLEDQTDWLYEG